MAKVLRRWIHYKDRYRQSPYVFCTNKGKAYSDLEENDLRINYQRYSPLASLKRG